MEHAVNSIQLEDRFTQGLKWRCIGPPRGGRVVAVAGHPTQREVFYFGACAGGVWKSEDAGTSWENISDGYFNSAAIGALTVAQADPNIMYAGTGETTIRLDVSYGDGVYRSTDGGASWQHLGLEETRHIGAIRVDPRDPDRVYVAALGHAFGPNSERGVYRSLDGGRNWQQVLFRSDKAGAIDLSLDPTNPRILYASLWQAQRTFWDLSSGGPDSSLYKSVDGGDTWEEITDKPGLPAGIKGKMGVVASPARAGRIWAIVEAEKAGLYRSDDGGATWELVSDERGLIERPWYYCHVFADPQNEDTVWVANLRLWKSTDGGCNFVEVTTPHGDNHALWIDADDPRRMIEGNDGGACVSFNGGASWSTIYNQLTAQFYRLDTDNRFPYRVYATQQDNSSIAVPSATEFGAIAWTDCYPAGTGESGAIAVDPGDDDIVFLGAVGSSPGGSGALQRYDHRTRQIRLVNVWPEEYFGWGAGDLKYRFSWTFPIAFSPHDRGVLYAAGNEIFRSRDQGSSWESISPDLTRADPYKLKVSGGPLTIDASGAENYGTVYAFAESSLQAGLLWAGSDDGLVHVSSDGGGHWEEVTPADLPEWALIGCIEPSRHDAQVAYLAATRYKLDDYRAYIYKTEDGGRSWQAIAGLPTGQISRVVREDPVCPGLLYVGTETGIYASVDDGVNWRSLQGNLPVVPVYDLAVKDGDLVAATHGRSFWILDDVAPLRQLAADAAGGTRLFAPSPAYRRWLQWGAFWKREAGDSKYYMTGLGGAALFRQGEVEDGSWGRQYLDAGENPPQGVLVYYWLEEDIEEPLALSFRDAQGEEITAFTSCPDEEDSGDEEQEKDTGPAEVYAPPCRAGLNRFVWDMRYPDAPPLAGPDNKKGTNGPLAPPGRYQVVLEVGTQTWTQSFEICKDPRSTATPDEFQAQFELWRKIRDKTAQVHAAVDRVRQLRQQVEQWRDRAQKMDEEGAEVVTAARQLDDKLKEIEGQLSQTEDKSGSGGLRLPVRLNDKIAGLASVVACADEAPPQQAYEVFDHLAREIEAQRVRLDGLVAGDIAAFDDIVRRCGIPALSA
ncbi:MAG: glycosyl hydrolase [Candidatus Latescibacteria bacterium]|nr:glycosyl hydrolase [Candidatus Latescibacterota bacterium]